MVLLVCSQNQNLHALKSNAAWQICMLMEANRRNMRRATRQQIPSMEEGIKTKNRKVWNKLKLVRKMSQQLACRTKFRLGNLFTIQIVSNSEEFKRRRDFLMPVKAFAVCHNRGPLEHTLLGPEARSRLYQRRFWPSTAHFSTFFELFIFSLHHSRFLWYFQRTENHF